MAFTSIMTTEAVIDQKAGAGASASYTDTMKTAACLHAENFVNAYTQYNWSDNYATLNVDVKYLLDDIVSSMVAIQAICYDMSGYTTRTEAEDIINVLRDGLLRNLSILRDVKVQEFVQDA